MHISVITFVAHTISLPYCFLGTNYAARKFHLLLLIPYKGIYLKLLRRIHTHYITEVISSYLLSAPNLLRAGDFDNFMTSEITT